MIVYITMNHLTPSFNTIYIPLNTIQSLVITFLYVI